LVHSLPPGLRWYPPAPQEPVGRTCIAPGYFSSHTFMKVLLSYTVLPERKFFTFLS
jgi:hypothetical protein